MTNPITVYIVTAFDSAFPHRRKIAHFANQSAAHAFIDGLESIGLETTIHIVCQAYANAEEPLKAAKAYFNSIRCQHDP